MPPPGGATSSAPRSPVAADRAAEVWWYDAGEVTLTPADVADLDVRETARAAAFVFPGDRHRYQVAHVMLRQVLASRLGSEPGRLVFTREPCPTCGGPSGKPVLASAPDRAQAPPAPFFSLAHSGTAVAIAVASQPVGVDVEREATGCLCSLVTAMHPGDAAIVEHLPEPERHTAVIRWWVRAEAVLKCAGTGIAHGMDAFPVLGGLERNKASPGSRLPTDSAAPSWAWRCRVLVRGAIRAQGLPGGDRPAWAQAHPLPLGTRRPVAPAMRQGAVIVNTGGPGKGPSNASSMACPRVRENLPRLWLHLARAQIGREKADFRLQRGAPRAAGDPGRRQSGGAGL